MEKLTKNVIHSWGKAGEVWLASLPHLISELAQHWNLKNIQAVDNLSWNYVATAIQNNLTPVVLKISYDQQAMLNEYHALNHFAGINSISVLNFNLSPNALLLSQALPGHSLKIYCALPSNEIINIYANIVKSIANHPLLKEINYMHVSTWLAAIDRINDPRIASYLIEKAQVLRTTLLSEPEREYLCHGDLHLDNIIQQGEAWLAIDPKGVIGEMAFEAAAFDLLNPSELMQEDTVIAAIISSRVTTLAQALSINQNRLLSWIFLRVIIAAQWFIEDNGDPTKMIALMNILKSVLVN